MHYLALILTVALIHLLAVMSPGPDFIMILRSSIKYGRRSAIYSSAGLGSAILLHVTYCLAGIALIISRSILIFDILKYLGAAYLIYVGVKTLMARSHKDTVEVSSGHKETLSPRRSFRLGFITNATNPKATLFFLSLFTLVIQPSTPLWVKIIMGIEMSIATFAWFSLLSIALSHHFVLSRVSKIQHYAEKFMGGVLILFGLKVASEHAK